MWVRKVGEGSVYVRIKLSEHEGVAERKRKKVTEIEIEREKQVRLINTCCVKLR